ncbi:MAG: MoaD/ThiS family protein [Theionarchaea archaeon]|nr:MoaD/ThiS family protein [Theionarchaea archaeon]
MSESITLDFPFSVIGVNKPAKSTISLNNNIKTVEDVFRHLTRLHEPMKNYFFDEKGEWNSIFNIFVNKKSILDLKGEKTVLHPGDVVTVLFPYSGG